MRFDMRKTSAMITKRLQSQLEAGKMPPVNALRLTPEQADGLLPLLTDILDKTGSGVFPLPREEHLLFHGLHVLAAARCQGLWRPLLAWLRSPYADIDSTLGFGYADEILPGILAFGFRRRRRPPDRGDRGPEGGWLRALEPCSTFWPGWFSTVRWGVTPPCP